jgi:hypothetical protein
LAAGIPRVWGNIMVLRKIVYKIASKDQHPSIEVKNEIIDFGVTHITLYLLHCISGQITIWLISILEIRLH